MILWWYDIGPEWYLFYVGGSFIYRRGQGPLNLCFPTGAFLSSVSLDLISNFEGVFALRKPWQCSMSAASDKNLHYSLPAPWQVTSNIANCFTKSNLLRIWLRRQTSSSMPPHRVPVLCLTTTIAPSQWEMSLQSNAISHWLGANEMALSQKF